MLSRALILTFLLALVSCYPVQQEDEDDRTIDEILADATSPYAAQSYAMDGVVVTELDIRYDIDEWIEMQREEMLPHAERQKRKALRSDSKRWTNGVIPYAFTPDTFELEHIERIHIAMDSWAQYTCLKFRPNQANDRNYFTFYSGSGCSSAVGMGKKPQKLSLGNGCRGVKTVLHELGHTIGLHHEQCRYDRDSYIEVLMENVKEGKGGNFNKKDETKLNLFDVEYDYGSVMHYGTKAFSANKQPTIITKDPKMQSVIGKAKTHSFADLKIVNAMYDCASHCDNRKCPSNGYLDKNCVCQCKSSDNFIKPCK